MEREEIMRAVWPGVVVTEDSITQCVREIRRALGDEDQRLLRTLPRRGFLFAAEVSRADGSVAPGPAAPAVAVAQAAPLAGGASGPPMLVVLPFANLTGDPDQDYFADGITEDLTDALSRLRWFAVIARNSAFTYKGRAVDVRQVGRELGARYVLEGSVSRAGGRGRVTARLCRPMPAGRSGPSASTATWPTCSTSRTASPRPWPAPLNQACGSARWPHKTSTPAPTPSLTGLAAGTGGGVGLLHD